MYFQFALVFLAVIASSCAPRGQGQLSAHSNHGQGGEVAVEGLPAVHGMVLFGDEELYISHIPMFAKPHDWQALISISLSHPQDDALAHYRSIQGNRGQSLTTLAPKPFVLHPLLLGELKEFAASLHEGHFEQGGRQDLEGIRVTIKKILMTAPLRESSPGSEQLSYLALGKGKRGFLVHKLTSSPGFDHIVAFEWQKGPNIQDWHNANEPVSLMFPERSDLQASRLRADQSFWVVPHQGRFQAMAKTSEPMPLEAVGLITITDDFYCAEGPDFFERCR